MSKKKKNKIIPIVITSLIGAFVLVGINHIFKSEETHIEESPTVLMAIKNAILIEEHLIDEVVQFNLNDDYSLSTLLDVINQKPMYIVTNGISEYDKHKIEDLIINIQNKNYKEGDIIELAWRTDNDRILTTYIATDISDNVEIVGLFTNSIDIDGKLSEKLPKIDKSFDEIIDYNKTLEDLESEYGKMYVSIAQYPLNQKSNMNKSETELESDTFLKLMMRSNNSNVTIHIADNKTYGFSNELDNYDNLVIVSDMILTQLDENENLTEKEFLESVSKPVMINTFVYDDFGAIQTMYMFKGEDNKNYAITFRDEIKTIIQRIE